MIIDVDEYASMLVAHVRWLGHFSFVERKTLSSNCRGLVDDGLELAPLPSNLLLLSRLTCGRWRFSSPSSWRPSPQLIRVVWPPLLPLTVDAVWLRCSWRRVLCCAPRAHNILPQGTFGTVPPLPPSLT